MKLATLIERTLGARWALGAALILAGLAGCDTDSYLDPSVTGRWESTPVVLPILDRLDVIEEPEEIIAGLSEVRSSDLIPEVSEYVMGPGDLITVTVFELITPNIESVQTRRVDELGFIRLPVVGQIRAGGLSTRQLEQRIIDILDPEILRNPTVTVIVQEGRQKTFNVLGAVGAVGTYTLLKSNFRLLDAIALARGMPADIDKLYVVRQVPLSDLVEHGYTVDDQRPGAHRPPMEARDPTRDAAATEPGGGGEDGLDPGQLIEDLTRELEGDAGGADEQPVEGPEPAEAPDEETSDVAAPLAEAIEGDRDAGGRWVNVGGKWVQVAAKETAPVPAPGEDPTIAGGPDALADGQLPGPDQLVTQRVIEVDAQELIKGAARYNIVIRPGDLIRVPAPRTGNIFIGGAIARPGTYALPGERELTLTQAIKAAGGLSPVGIPERVDLRRRLDKQTEAMVRLNYRAIAEGVQPNIYLKPDDEINVGTNIVAPFLAVTRNSFRMTYGFGFLLDRNFATKVFGEQFDN